MNIRDDTAGQSLLAGKNQLIDNPHLNLLNYTFFDSTLLKTFLTNLWLKIIIRRVFT